MGHQPPWVFVHPGGVFTPLLSAPQLARELFQGGQ
jgi:hypothetical protein